MSAMLVNTHVLQRQTEGKDGRVRRCLRRMMPASKGKCQVRPWSNLLFQVSRHQRSWMKIFMSFVCRQNFVRSERAAFSPQCLVTQSATFLSVRPPCNLAALLATNRPTLPCVYLTVL